MIVEILVQRLEQGKLILHRVKAIVIHAAASKEVSSAVLRESVEELDAMPIWHDAILFAVSYEDWAFNLFHSVDIWKGIAKEGRREEGRQDTAEYRSKSCMKDEACDRPAILLAHFSHVARRPTTQGSPIEDDMLGGYVKHFSKVVEDATNVSVTVLLAGVSC
jgi:hypothetical protein